MSPSTIYASEGVAWLNRLAVATGINRKYLYQLVSGRRRPSPDYAKRMIEADSRLSLDAIYGAAASPHEPRQEAAAPVRALACSNQSVRLNADRRELTRRETPVTAPHPDQFPLALAADEPHKEAA